MYWYGPRASDVRRAGEGGKGPQSDGGAIPGAGAHRHGELLYTTVYPMPYLTEGQADPEHG